LQAADLTEIGFMELAPENWIGVGGRLRRQLEWYAERFPLVCHGLSLSIGAREPLDQTYLGRLKAFLDEYEVEVFSDHLSYCSDHGHLYDLMPLPFMPETVAWVADRVLQVQDALGRQIALENISYYAPIATEMSELDFITEVCQRADCLLLLDVNNVHVNSVNHGYDADEFLAALPHDRVVYLHIAGHHHEAEDLIVDTHGAAVADSVWELLRQAYVHVGPMPTLLERDFNFPPVPELLAEVSAIANIQSEWDSQHAA
jgi:uncharacterized protein (UPF0276 family)